MRLARLLPLPLFALALVGALPAQDAASHLTTRWTASVSRTNPLPDYPRPQLVRRAWQSLNGPWQYAITAKDAARPATWDGTILVPFAVQSQLSGVQRAVSDSQALWYRRTFTAPALPPGGRLLLHFGAVDWQATVMVNGKEVGTHKGGYDPFTFDITDALRGSGEQELVVAVWDPTNRGGQPRGKQVLRPRGIWYTAVTGIWQTVWLEPVRAAHIDALQLVPDIDAKTLTVIARPGNDPAIRVTATALANGRPVASATGPGGQSLVLHLADPHLWSPADPYLYDLRVSLSGGDTVQSYFGMRKISVGTDPRGYRRLFLNNEPLFQFGMLDQGWWPDGLYTAPTDDALRSDIEGMKRLGFNMIRKHVKVEPARWYYDADRLGMLVWQDMPSGDNTTEDAKLEFARELRQVVDALRNHPAIVMWVPFNEGWGQHLTEQYVAWLRGDDPSRLIDNASGWTDQHVGDVADIHAYPGPAMPPLEKARAAVLGEFGGLGLPLAGHTWLAQDNWGYRSFTSRDSLAAAYHELLAQLRLLEADGLSAAVYTQTTDVEVEVNGLMTYDREVVKLPAEAATWAKALFGPLPELRTVLPTARNEGTSWRFTTKDPGAGWSDPALDDQRWDQGIAGFGTPETPGAVVRTTWNTPDIWLRRRFTLTSAPSGEVYWQVHHDEDAEVYLNGQLVATLKGYTSGYVRIPLGSQARAALRQGNNLLAVHVHQTTGGQYFDLGIDEVRTP